MSSYDAAIIDVTILEDHRLLAMPRGTRLLHVESYVWARAHRTDGEIPRNLLARIAFDEPDPATAAAQLVDAGLWAVTETGWRIVDFLETQWSRATVKRKRDQNRKRYEEWVARQDSKKGDEKPPRKAKRVGNATANGADTDADSDPDPEREGESAGRNGDDDGHEGPVVALAMRKCVGCNRDFLGAGYGKGEEPVCSWRCRDSNSLQAVPA